MIISGSSVPDGEEIAADICVIGAGPAGLTVAKEFDGSSRRVYVLETGGEHLDEFSKRMADGDSVGHPYFPLSESRARVLGGSTYIWEEWMRARPLDPSDFKKREWVSNSGWPFSIDHLQPYYREAHDTLGLGPFEYEALDGGWESNKFDTLRKVRFRYSDSGDFTTARSWLDRSDNVCLITGATALELVGDRNAKHTISYVRASAANPHRFKVCPRVVVLAGGGIENARLLLLSSGIGNEHDQVGRYFMEHPRVSMGRVDFHEDQDPPTDLTLVAGQGWGTRVAFAPTPELMESHSILNGMILLTPASEREVSDLVRSLAIIRDRFRGVSTTGESLPGHLVNVGRSPIKSLRSMGFSNEVDPRILRVSVTVEQSPDAVSRVTLGPRLDPFGQRVPRLYWKIGEAERRTVAVVQRSLGEMLARNGMGEITGILGGETPARAMRGEWHQMGTTRMSTDARHGVVDPDLLVHGQRNLYISGASVFPTVGYANPTLTIVALSLKLSRHLKKTLEGTPSLGPIW